MDENLAPNGNEWKRIRLPERGRPEGTRTDTRYAQFEQQLFRDSEAAEQRRRHWNSRGWKPKKPKG